MPELVSVRLAHQASVYDYLARAPIENVVAMGLVREADLATPDPERLEIVGCREGDEWLGVATRTSFLTAYATDPRAHEPLALFAASRLGMAPQLTGPTATIDGLWETLRHFPFPVRFDRRQIVLAMAPEDLTHRGPVPGLAPARLEDLEEVTRLAAAMAEEEIQTDPLALDPEGYRRHIAGLIGQGRYFVLKEDGVIKYLVGLSAVTPEAADVAGGYTPPPFRRQGYAKRGLGEACRLAFAESARLVGVVNDFNEAPLRLNRALGFRDSGATLRTIHWEVPRV